MRETKHTAGPWMIVNYGDGDSLVIHSDSESRICFMATPGSHGDPAKIRADARLIAAAPDMLEALKAVIGSHETLVIKDKPLPDARFETVSTEAIAAARAAAAKAEGRS